VGISITPTPSLMPPQPPLPLVYDLDRLPQDPTKKLSIVSYPINDQDAVRRTYILKGPFKPYAQDFKKKERMVLGITYSILYDFTNIIGFNIVLRMMPHFSLYASCSKGWGTKVFLPIVDGGIGIEIMH
jgi:hypothetical protein